jgi:hypothetical protein
MNLFKYLELHKNKKLVIVSSANHSIKDLYELISFNIDGKYDIKYFDTYCIPISKYEDEVENIISEIEKLKYGYYVLVDNPMIIEIFEKKFDIMVIRLDENFEIIKYSLKINSMEKIK